MKTMTKISQVRVFLDPFVACACNSIVFERFIRKRITTVVWRESIDGFLKTTKTHTFEKALVSTGPQTDKEQTKEKKKI